MKVKSLSILLATSIAALVTHACLAATVRVFLQDPAGKPVPNVVMVLTPPATASAPATTQTVLDQIDKTFVPEVLVIRTGTAVTFPNSDSIAHQVYSFSPAKRFALPLYRGKPYPPVVFDQPGVVTLGCNIHDGMVGYIFVTDSPYFGKTDTRGRIEFDSLLPATYQLSIWSPHLIKAEKDRSVVVDTNDSELTIRLAHRPHSSPNSPKDRRLRDY
jgi:plastocyanin